MDMMLVVAAGFAARHSSERTFVSTPLQAPIELLSADHLSALRNLASKQSGHTVGWIAIAEAQGLTELGYARRSRCGWEITANGSEALSLLRLSTAHVSGAVLPFHGR